MINLTDKVADKEQSRQSAVRYAIDAGVSRITVRAFATGLLSAFGHHPVIAAHDFTGEAEVAEDSLEHAVVHLTVRSGLLTVENDISDKDRKEMQRAMREDVLEAEKFPEIKYDCARVSGSGENGQYAATLNGDLTLHGVTRNQEIAVRAFVMGNMLRASGEFTLRQSDYRIKPVSAVGGGLKLKDEVKVTFELVARKQS
ncbi:MAG TPA: YceI family protein [Candidatus Angelobacter sp.]|nr:YceI family protein [Candidatus Angelobacter sp.]